MLMCPKQNCTCPHHQLLDFIKKGSNDEAQLLLEKLENPCDLADDSGYTLLHHSAKHDNKDMVLNLIEIGCNINATEYSGFTALILAVREKHVSTIEVLLKNEADIYVIDRNGWNSLQIAFDSCLFQWSVYQIEPQSSPIWKMLFEQMDRDFLTNRRTVERLMLNANNMTKMAAVVCGNVELARLILKEGYPINFCEPDQGYTALRCAIAFARIENVKVLIEHGASIDVMDKFGMFPLHDYTCTLEPVDKNSEVLKSILKSRRGWTSGCKNLTGSLLEFGNRETVKTVLESGINRRAKFAENRTLLHVLVENDNVHAVDIPEEFDVDIVNLICSRGETALTAAIRCGCVSKVEFLLRCGADVNAKCKFNQTPLFYATVGVQADDSTIFQETYAKIMELLLRHGADFQVAFENMRICFARCNDRLAIKVIMAHLALIDIFDASRLSDRVRNDIQSYSEWAALFRSCAQQLEEMRSIVVHNKISLLELLNEKDDEKMMAYARDRKFIVAFDKAMKSISHFNSYYLNILRGRLERAIYQIELDRNAALACESLTGLCSDAYHPIIYKIISYLNEKEKHRLSEV